MFNMPKKLKRKKSKRKKRSLKLQWYRSADNAVFAGVCGGLGHKLGISVTGLRFVVAIGALFFWLPLCGYIILWLILQPAYTTR